MDNSARAEAPQKCGAMLLHLDQKLGEVGVFGYMIHIQDYKTNYIYICMFYTQIQNYVLYESYMDKKIR